VFAAYTEDEARTYAESKSSQFENASITLIGTSIDDTVGEIVTSFNAG